MENGKLLVAVVESHEVAERVAGAVRMRQGEPSAVAMPMGSQWAVYLSDKVTPDRLASIMSYAQGVADGFTGVMSK